MLKRCPDCGKQYLVDLERCPHCAAENKPSPEDKIGAIKDELSSESYLRKDLVRQLEFSSLKERLRTGLVVIIVGLIIPLLAGLLASGSTSLDELRVLAIASILGYLIILAGVILIYFDLREHI